MSYEEPSLGLGYTPGVGLLVQQCLEYHEKQESIRQQQQQHFVLAKRDDHAPTPATATTTRSQDIRVEEGRARAQAILAKFEKQQHEMLPVIDGKSSIHSVFAEQRRKGLERETRRKQLALLKNLEYVSNKESDRILSLSTKVSQASEFLSRMDQNYKQHLAQRRQDKTQKEEPSTVAVYVSGIINCDETVLRQLFGSYGPIQKIHFYRDKETKQLKGDGLVIYAVDKDDQNLLGTVCSQLNGAELPSGEVLSVEPAKTNKSGTTGTNTPTESPEPRIPDETNACSSHHVEEDDLADFFDSL